MGDFSMIWCSWAKMAVVGRISRSGVIVDDIFRLDKVEDGSATEKLVVFDEKSLVELDFRFFIFRKPLRTVELLCNS